MEGRITPGAFVRAGFADGNHGDSAANGLLAADRRVLVIGAQAPMR